VVHRGRLGPARGQGSLDKDHAWPWTRGPMAGRERRRRCLKQGLAGWEARCFTPGGGDRLDSVGGLNMQPCVAACAGFRLTGGADSSGRNEPLRRRPRPCRKRAGNEGGDEQTGQHPAASIQPSVACGASPETTDGLMMVQRAAGDGQWLRGDSTGLAGMRAHTREHCPAW